MQGTLPQSMNEALIIVILKPGKDPLLPNSCWPISLLTSNVKLLAKVLATRLSTIIDTLVYPDQLGFIPE